MTDIKNNEAREDRFEEMHYRLIYLRPSASSDEQLVVGVIAERERRLQARMMSAPSSVAHLTRLLGEDGVEQFQFAASELRRAVSMVNQLDALRLPSQLLVAGERQFAIAADPASMMESILKSASSLARLGGYSPVESVASAGSVTLKRDLYQHVSRIYPLAADKLFDQRVVVKTGEEVQLPILGQRIYGAAVSFATSDQRTVTEAFLAKFHWLRVLLPQQPRVYILGPDESRKQSSLKTVASIREIEAIATSLNVPIRVVDSTEEMALRIVRDEAA